MANVYDGGTKYSAYINPTAITQVFPFTLCTWVRFPAVGGANNNTFIQFTDPDQGANNQYYGIRFRPDGIMRAQGQHGLGNTRADSLAAVSLNVWHHVSVTWKTTGSIIDMWLDGVLQDSFDTTTPDLLTSPRALSLGAAINTGLNGIRESQCDIANAVFWNGFEPSVEDIAALVKGISPLDISTGRDSIIGFYPLYGVNGDAVDVDLSGNEFSLTKNNFLGTNADTVPHPPVSMLNRMDKGTFPLLEYPIILMDSTIDAVSDMPNADMTLRKSLASTVAGVSAVTSQMGVRLELASTVNAVSTVNATNLLSKVLLSSTIVATSTVVVSELVAKTSLGSTTISAVSTLSSSNFNVIKTFDSTIPAVSTVSANLASMINLEALISATGGAGGEMDVFINLNAEVDAVSTVTASKLDFMKFLSATVEAQSNVAATNLLIIKQ